MSSKIYYTIQLLNDNIIRDNAKLIGSYDKLNRDTSITFICNCGIEYSKKFRYINEVGAKCNNCTDKDKITKRKRTNLILYGVEHSIQNKIIQEKVKNTMINRFGVEHAKQSQEIKEKTKKTMIERFGVEHALQNIIIKEKFKKTNLEKFGVENVSQLYEIREKVKKTNLEKFGTECGLLNPIIKEKTKKTMLKKYNVLIPLKNEKIKQQIKYTNFIRYGVEHALQSEEIKKKAINTCLTKYGTEYASQSTKIKNKYKETCLKRYGVEHISQCQEIQEIIQKNGKKFKQYTFPSGTIRKVQGYEPFALNELIKTYQEDDILTDRKDIPRIQYYINDKKRYYFPDIYIKSINKIIEVKSTWTYKSKTDNIQEKEKATKEAGYDYEIWIYDSKGNKLKIE